MIKDISYNVARIWFSNIKVAFQQFNVHFCEVRGIVRNKLKGMVKISTAGVSL